MKLSLISEVQFKNSDTNMSRVSTTMVYGVGSVNDLYHFHYGTRKLKGTRKNAKKRPR